MAGFGWPLRFIFALVLVLVVLALLIGIVIEQNKASVTSAARNIYSNPILRTVNIGDAALTVPSVQYRYYTLVVPEGAHNVHVQGHFTATGGAGNDIEVFVINPDNFTNWKNHHRSSSYYNSGKVTVGDVAAILPDGAGTYYLVFNNNFSMLTGKAVGFSGTMTYYQ